jgi:nucleoside-diphosphate-sugar epimerase
MIGKALVTGGAGFIGSHMVRMLLDRGIPVVVLDDLSTGKRENLAAVAESITFIEGSILDRALLDRAVASCSHVFHFAAQVSVAKSMALPDETHLINTTGTLNVFEAARAAGVSRVVYAASCAMYGSVPGLPKLESDPPNPQSPYAVSKYVGEIYGACYTESMELDVVSMRFFNVYGPRQDPSGGYAAAIPSFITSMLSGAVPTIHGDGLQTRDFVYVENVAAACFLGSQVPEAAGLSFNIGTGCETSIVDIIKTLAEHLKIPYAPEFGPARLGDVRRSVASIDRAREILGYVPEVDLNEGLKRTIAWYERTS